MPHGCNPYEIKITIKIRIKNQVHHEIRERLRENVSLATLRALATIAGGEVVDEY